jgi:hypothetical protein
MSRRTLSRALAVLTLTLALAAPAYAAPAGHHPAHGSLWTRALSWLIRLVPLDKGGMMDPNGGH